MDKMDEQLIIALKVNFGTEGSEEVLGMSAFEFIIKLLRKNTTSELYQAVLLKLLSDKTSIFYGQVQDAIIDQASRWVNVVTFGGASWKRKVIE